MEHPQVIIDGPDSFDNQGAELHLVKPVACQTLASPLFLDGVLALNQQRWGLTPQRLRLSADGSELPAVETVLFTNHKGQITPARLSPYAPVLFEPTPTQSIARLERQWLDVGGLLAREMRKRGLANVIALAPEVTDVRPWQWAGFDVELRYVIHVPLPLIEEAIDASARKKANKAAHDGYRVELTTRMDDVIACLKSTQARQDFHLDLSEADLKAGMELIGPNALRTYVCYAPDGEPAAARVALHHPGTRAIDWAAGMNSEHSNAGANQLLIKHMLNDLYAAGATAFDFSDANHPSVAAMKANWGGDLVPVYAVDGGRVRALARHMRDYMKLHRGWPPLDRKRK